MSDYLADPEETREYFSRYKFLYGIILFTILLFLLRLWYLQIIKGTELRQFSEKNRIKEEKIQAPRGMILDREGRVLVDNQPGFDATITPQYASRLKETAEVVGEILNVPAQTIIKKVARSRQQNGSFRPARIKENLTRDEVARLERLKLEHPGLDINMSIKRSYLLKENGAQFFGYVGEISKEELPRINRNLTTEIRFEQGDIIGKSGLEQVYDRELRGADGMRFVQVDAHGREINTRTPAFLSALDQTQESEPGRSLLLTIDKDLQEAAYKAFNLNGKIGGVVALDPKSGEVLAWANGPSFDPNEFSTGISPQIWAKLVNDPFKPLRNKVIQDHTPPGSTFKAIVALAGLEEKVINTQSTYFCPGFLKFGRRPYHCHIRQGHGSVSVLHALEQSCDVFFYRLGIEMGIDTIAKYAKALGIGQKTEIQMFNEAAGLMPTSEWKLKAIGEEWQPGENLSNAIGQGFILTTPLQMATVFSAIANEGPLYTPYYVKKILDTEGHVVREVEPQLKRNLVTGFNSPVTVQKQNLHLVKEGLRMVVQGDRGTAKGARVPGVEVAGKTGTVQLFSLAADQVFAKCINRPIHQRHHGWFVSFAPAEDPKIVIAVLAEHACSGGGGAAPVAKEILMAYFKKYFPDRLKNATNGKLMMTQPQAIPAAQEGED